MIAEIGAKIALIENAMGTAANLPLAKIRTDGGTQARQGLDMATVGEYAVEMQNGAKFPALTIFYDGEAYWLADGFHRLAAAKIAGLAGIACDVRQGRQREAMLFACGANATHGLKRRDDDKRRAVMALLNDSEWRQWSDREIARRCAVSAPFVGSLRAKAVPTVNVYSSDDGAGEARTYERNGKTQTMNTNGIGKQKAAPYVKVGDIMEAIKAYLFAAVRDDLELQLIRVDNLLADRHKTYHSKWWDEAIKAMPDGFMHSNFVQALSNTRDKLQSQLRRQAKGGSACVPTSQLQQKLDQWLGERFRDDPVASDRDDNGWLILNSLNERGRRSIYWEAAIHAMPEPHQIGDIEQAVSNLCDIYLQAIREKRKGGSLIAERLEPSQSPAEIRHEMRGLVVAKPFDTEAATAGVLAWLRSEQFVSYTYTVACLNRLVKETVFCTEWPEFCLAAGVDWEADHAPCIDEMIGICQKFLDELAEMRSNADFHRWQHGPMMATVSYGDTGVTINMTDGRALMLEATQETPTAQTFEAKGSASRATWLDDQLAAIDEEVASSELATDPVMAYLLDSVGDYPPSQLGRIKVLLAETHKANRSEIWDEFVFAMPDGLSTGELAQLLLNTSHAIQAAIAPVSQPATPPTPYKLLLPMSDKQRGLVYNALKFSRSHYEPRTDGTDQSVNAFYYAMFTEAMALFDIQE